MIIQRNPLRPEQLPFPEADFPEDAVFFDIETTGLSHRASHVYMIGALCRQEDQIMLIQWFLQKPSEEKEALELFSNLLKGFTSVIHYNGQSFDIPYLQDRCRYWELPDPFEELSLSGIDLYRELRPMKEHFHLSSIKQKDLEELLEFPRTDEMSGKELIDVYRRYLTGAEEEDLRLLLLHNHDDLLGMLGIYRFRCFLTTAGNPSPSGSEEEAPFLQPADPSPLFREDSLVLNLKCRFPTPLAFRIRKEEGELSAEGDRITLTVFGTRGVFRHYYSNYKDYYYLPLEDTAIHKSVGIYVDPSSRVKAKADTCYTKKEGLFFFQPSLVFLPDFRRDGRKGPSFFTDEQLQQEPSLFMTYARSLLSWFLSKK